MTSRSPRFAGFASTASEAAGGDQDQGPAGAGARRLGEQEEGGSRVPLPRLAHTATLIGHADDGEATATLVLVLTHAICHVASLQGAVLTVVLVQKRELKVVAK